MLRKININTLMLKYYLFQSINLWWKRAVIVRTTDIKIGWLLFKFKPIVEYINRYLFDTNTHTHINKYKYLY